MSFLDNLENTLKSLEKGDERDSGSSRKSRDIERRWVVASAPWAERLKQEPFASQLIDQATVAAHGIRAKLYLAWMGTTLRLELRGRKLELRPTPDGVVAVFLEPNGEQKVAPVNLDESPEALLRQWLPTA